MNEIVDEVGSWEPPPGVLVGWEVWKIWVYVGFFDVFGNPIGRLSLPEWTDPDTVHDTLDLICSAYLSGDRLGRRLDDAWYQFARGLSGVAVEHGLYDGCNNPV